MRFRASYRSSSVHLYAHVRALAAIEGRNEAYRPFIWYRQFRFDTAIEYQ